MTQSVPTPEVSTTSTTQRQFQQPNSTTDKGLAKRPTLAGLGVSISAINQASKQEAIEDIKQVKELNNHFTPLQLINTWKTYAETLTEEHHLKNTMLSCLPELLNNTTFDVVVNNPVQEQRLNDNATDIMTFIRENLQNTQIIMQIRISIDNEKKLGFTALERFNLMLEQNDALKRLKDEFGLELL